MAEKYTVTIVSPSEFTKIAESEKGCPHARQPGEMGFSNPKENQAWVKNTHSLALNRYLLEHEFEHLLEDEGTDECECGIRHKRGPTGRQILATLVRFGGAAAGGAVGGPLGGAAGGALGEAGATAIERKGKTNARDLLTVAPRGALTGAAIGGGISGLKGLGAGGATAAPGAALPASSSSTPASVLPRAGLLAGVPGGAQAGGAPAFFTSNILGQNTPPPSPGGGNGFNLRGLFAGAPGGAQVGGGTQTPSGLAQFLSSGAAKTLLPAAAGLGIAGFGQIAGPKRPNVPNLGQLPAIQRFGQEVRTDLGGLSQRAAGLSTTPLPENLASPIKRQYDQLRQQVTSQFKVFRPGADLATDSAYRQAIQSIDQQEAEQMTQAQFEFQGNERQNIATQLGIDLPQLQMLGELAGLDIQTIMAQTGLQAEDAAKFKELFGNLGIAVAAGPSLGRFTT